MALHPAKISDDIVVQGSGNEIRRKGWEILRHEVRAGTHILTVRQNGTKAVFSGPTMRRAFYEAVSAIKHGEILP